MTTRVPWKPAAAGALLTLVVGAAHPQTPLYHSNQNAHFLHGLAAGGLGFLSRDWTAATPDYYPVFSRLVEWTYRWLPLETFYLYYAALLGVFLVSVVAIGRRIAGIAPGTLADDVYVTASVLLLSSAVNHVAIRGFDIDAAKLLYDGLGGYYVLGGYFQPLVLGVLAFASVACFLAERRRIAVVLLAVLVTIHLASVLMVATIVLAYMVSVWRRDRSWSAAVGLGVATLILALPAVGWAVMSFRPSSDATARLAQEVLVYVRAPHHYVPAVWWDWTATVKVAIVVAAAWLVRTTAVFLVFVVPLVVAIGLTIVQIATGHVGLALLMPWRIFAFLVPLAWMVALATAVRFVADRLPDAGAGMRRLVRAGCVTALILAGATGVLIQAIELRAWAHTDAMPMLRHVAATKTERDVYLIPPALEKFRLHTGAPAFVDEKSIPFRDFELLEWHRRMTLATLVETTGAQDCELLTRLHREERVTHVVVKEPASRRCARLERGFRDAHWSVFRLAGLEPAR